MEDPKQLLDYWPIGGGGGGGGGGGRGRRRWRRRPGQPLDY